MTNKLVIINCILLIRFEKLSFNETLRSKWFEGFEKCGYVYSNILNYSCLIDCDATRVHNATCPMYIAYGICAWPLGGGNGAHHWSKCIWCNNDTILCENILRFFLVWIKNTEHAFVFKSLRTRRNTDKPLAFYVY